MDRKSVITMDTDYMNDVIIHWIFTGCLIGCCVSIVYLFVTISAWCERRQRNQDRADLRKIPLDKRMTDRENYNLNSVLDSHSVDPWKSFVVRVSGYDIKHDFSTDFRDTVKLSTKLLEHVLSPSRIYVHYDEVVLIFPARCTYWEYDNIIPIPSHRFNGSLETIMSLATSIVSQTVGKYLGTDECLFTASRAVFEEEDRDELDAYVSWRQRVTKNLVDEHFVKSESFDAKILTTFKRRQ